MLPRACHHECPDGGARVPLRPGLGFGLWLGDETVKGQPDIIPLPEIPENQLALELGFWGLRLIPKGRSRALVSGILGADRGLTPVPMGSPGTGGSFRRPCRTSRAM
eukprot:15106889-Heterocapsa_arctica.AAC.1